MKMDLLAERERLHRLKLRPAGLQGIDTGGQADVTGARSGIS
jgi:hypothetical protein